MIEPSCVIKSVGYMQPIFKISNLFGIYEQPGKKSKFFKIYAFLVVLALFSSASFSVYIKISAQFSRHVRSTSFLDIVMNIWRTTINIMAIFSVTNSNKSITDFINTIAKVDAILSMQDVNDFIKRQRIFFIEIITILILLTVSIIYKLCLTFVKNSNLNVLHFLVESTNKYIVVIIILIAYYFILSVRDRFHCINKKLLSDNGKNCNEFAMNLKALAKSHYLLCEAVEYLNENFGYKLFGAIILIGLDLIKIVHVLINVMLKYHKESFKIPIIYGSYILSSLVSLGLCIMIVTSCEQVRKHASNTAHICHNMSLNYPLTKQLSSFEWKLQEELLLLGHQANQRKPNFTAAYFFSINFKLLYAMLGSVMTYIIIILQIKE